MNTMCEFKWFTIADYDKEADYLRRMHRQGWKLERVGFPGFYHFVRCQAKDMIYQLDYNQEGVQHKSEYVQMFADCGWEYLFDFVGFSYFRKPAGEDVDESIFCDNESRVQMMERVIKGRLTPLLVVFCAVLVPQFILFSRHMDDAIYLGFFVFYAVMLASYIAIFTYVGASYLALKNKKE